MSCCHQQFDAIAHLQREEALFLRVNFVSVTAPKMNGICRWPLRDVLQVLQRQCALDVHRP